MAMDTELTVKRIQRLLRRVRVACVTLGKHKAPRRATYASGTSAKPLTMLAPPSSVSWGGEEVELARRVYGVRDAFRELVRSVGGGGKVGLAEMCAIVVGANIEEEENEEEEEEEEEGEGELYEAVPVAYRRLTVLAHATSLIVAQCPPSPTLYHILLAVARENGLVYESETFLRALLDVSFATPAALHPRFLVDTCDGMSHVLIDALAATPAAWTCRALDVFVQKNASPTLVLDMGFPLLDAARGNTELQLRYDGWLTTYVVPHRPVPVSVAQLVCHAYDLRAPPLDGLVSLAALSVPHPKAIAFLRDAEPHPLMFAALAAGDDVHDVGWMLRESGLPRLEASFWACVQERGDVDVDALLEDAECRWADQEDGQWDAIGCWVPRKKPNPNSPFVSLLRRAARKRERLHVCESPVRKRMPPPVFSSPAVIPSSDDALDMIGYA